MQPLVVFVKEKHEWFLTKEEEIQTDRQKKRKEEIPLFLPNATVKDLM